MKTLPVRNHTSLILTCALLICGQAALAQPSLTPTLPPTAPSGRMGVRTEIRTIPYFIATPGSYYLSNNLLQTIPGASGITVAANDVTIDLNGFTITGLAFAGTSGITFAPGGPFRDLTIHNGYVTAWGGAGINIGTIANGHVWEVTSYGNGGEGFVIGPTSIVRHVIATNNLGVGVRTNFGCKVTNALAFYNSSDGINVGMDCHVSDSVGVSNSGNGIVVNPNGVLIGSTFDNNGFDGVMLTTNCRVTDCAAANNGLSGGFGSGFFAGGDGNILGGCAANYNFMSGFESLVPPVGGGSSVHDCIATFNGFPSGGIGDGFTNFKSVVECTANGNAGDGIQVFVGGHIYRNTCEGNGANGIEATSNGNVIEQNHVASNGAFGITTVPNIGPGGNFVASNRAHLNVGGAFATVVALDTTGLVMVGPIVLGAPASAMANIAY